MHILLTFLIAIDLYRSYKQVAKSWVQQGSTVNGRPLALVFKSWLPAAAYWLTVVWKLSVRSFRRAASYVVAPMGKIWHSERGQPRTSIKAPKLITTRALLCLLD
jgi:hypothetical protein